MKQRTFLLLMAGWMFLTGCSPRHSKNISGYTMLKDYQEPDYSRLDNWAAHPFKHDPSDSVPASLLTQTIKDSTVDVFFLHPTTLTSGEDTNRNAFISDAALNKKTDHTSVLYQASAFNECRVFAPRYRQAHYRNYFDTDTTNSGHAFDLAYRDVKEAFRYFLDHYNNNRPIIIASHSQGTTHAKRLLKEFFENSVLKNRLVAAYIIGMYIPENYFTDLTMCETATETGCFVGWRTYKKGYEPDFVKKEKYAALVTNPLTWTTTNEYAPYRLNKGGVITNFNRLRMGLADAQIHNGVLWINRPHIPGSILLRMKNFHVGDINLFYVNIRENVRTRISAFWKR